MKKFEKAVYRGFMVRLDISAALHYLEETGQNAARQSLFDRLTKKPSADSGDGFADGVLGHYFKYYQECFTPPAGARDKEKSESEARKRLTERLCQTLQRGTLDEAEEIAQKEFEKRGLNFLGGMTGGYYGPYVWRKTTEETYKVEIPSGTQNVRVFWMDGFVTRGMLSWLSGDEIGAGGWAKEEGLYCVKNAYEKILGGPEFSVSFLKHEAQHKRDFKYRGLESCELEYRAKLVELIYYPTAAFLSSLNLSKDFTNKGNSHAYAAAKIMSDLEKIYKDGFRKNDFGLFVDKLIKDEKAWHEHGGFIRESAGRLLRQDTERLEEK